MVLYLMLWTTACVIKLPKQRMVRAEFRDVARSAPDIFCLFCLHEVKN